MTEFDEFWASYPRRKEKFRAHTAYNKARKFGTHEQIMKGVHRYSVEVMGKDQRFTKHPATWLNAGCWLDYEGMAMEVAAIALGQPRIFKCSECFQVTIGTECAHCRRMMA